MRYKNIVWDWNGTLLDDIRISVETLNRMLAGKNLKKISQPYNEKNDITFFEDEATTFIKVSPGEFAIFFPEDGHAPGIAEGKFRKVIVKVRI